MTKKKPVAATLSLTELSATYLNMIAAGELESVSPEAVRTYARDIAEKDALGEEVNVNAALHAAMHAIANLQKQLDALNFVIADAAGIIKDATKGFSDE